MGGCCESVKADPVPSGPICYLTSTGFVSESQWIRFIQVILKRRGVLARADEGTVVTREELVKKYAGELKKLKVTVINDASYHRPPEDMAKGRSGTSKVGEPHLGRGPGSWFWWDQAFEDKMGVSPNNIAMVQLLEKPWLFNRNARLANCKASRPCVADLDPEDEKAYHTALQLTQDAYNALKQGPHMAGAGQAGGSLPGCPDSGMNCANELAEISANLNTKYARALDKWCQKNIEGVDIIVGQGGEAVSQGGEIFMLNLAWQCNQAIAEHVVNAVHANKVIYAGVGASTMVCAKLMEMTGEIQPGWIEAFVADAKYLSRKEIGMVNLDGDTIQTNVLGALPMLEAPIAVHPHYTAPWEEEVLQTNLIAEKEIDEEIGIETREVSVCDSKDGCEVGCRLVTLISKEKKAQDNLVFVPIRNGKVIEININVRGTKVLDEKFHVIP